MDELQAEILGFLRRTVDADLELDTALLDSGLLDSFQVVELLSFVEAQFDLRLEPTDLSHDDLKSPRSIAALVVRLKQRSASSA